MKNTTLCYIINDDKYLMLHRVRKDNDQSHGKWLGIGGKFEDKESPDECLLREVYEETGLKLTSYRLRGIVSFISDIYETEYMFLYTADGFTGDLQEEADGTVTPVIDGKPVPCDEGVLKWIDIDKVPSLELWEGDRVFLKKLLETDDFFTLRLEYRGDTLISCK
ncbi:MAG: 8-oxo-dGTP diphosphatase [Lachnospiraceae bacterium]|nr:8-oxo-dGTP diphosphatase [Lachnospiraceae bacterium]